MSKIDHIMVVSHTHWDPEWYSTFEEYRMRLVDLMDKLLDILENVPGYHSFMFDGQVSPLESYLELFPENRERVRKLVKAGKLLVGPWFIMPDEYMVGPEAHIRNLLLGTRIARDYGEVMRVGYLPDMAGHISQMPQILRGFGIDSAVVWRGVAGYPETSKTEFLWESPDGSQVLALHLPWAYGTHLFLFDDVEYTSQKIQELKDRQETRNATRFMLLMNGGDHEEPHRQLPAIIEEIRKGQHGFELEHSNILEYIKAVRGELQNPDIHVGEMRRTETSFLMSGIQSTRVPIKQENARTEVLLEKYAEPLCTSAWLVGDKYPQRLLQAAWRYDLQNNFHDDIYGAHVDEVTPDVLNRYKHAQEIGERLVAIASHSLASSIDVPRWRKALVVFNPCSWDRTGVVDATIDFTWADNATVTPELQEALKAIYANSGLTRGGNVMAFRITRDGKDVPFQITGCMDFVKYQSERNIMDGQKPTGPVRRYQVAMLAEDIPAFGYRAYQIEPVSIDQTPTFESLVTVNGRAMENEFLKVDIQDGGYFTLTDKITGQVYRNCNILVDGGDVGDNYTYQAPAADRLVTNLGSASRYTVVETGPVRATIRVDVDFMLPASASPDDRSRASEDVLCPLSIYISLNAGVHYVTVRTEFDNRAKDHRLRATFRPEITARQVYVDGHFDILTRDVEVPVRPGWLEKPSPTQPQRNFVALRGQGRGFAVLNKGLIQYEATDEAQPALCVTLLRCIGYLSKEGLDERNGSPCGPGLPTPTAQCLGRHVFEYAVYPHDPAAVPLHEIHRAGQEFNAPMRAVDVVTRKGGTLPKELSFYRVRGAMASAYKKAEDGDYVILRLYNIANEAAPTEVECFRPVREVTEVSLGEVPVERPLAISRAGNKVYLTIPAKRIVTLRFQHD
ncbi:MAG TPA: hypothetical protein GXX51_07890 [Firmicutes bacterium]|nr:hypothetical protein [Bacillota bacterium]